ncbi:CbiX/SirB N-terminal domain-containing protein [Pseudoduganella sp. SL102]|uniref:Cobalamin biosynthesis protein CbiX n=1 Tax=Pseudoduganella albidiflava TaxID=321983 RepID=A0AA88C4Y2_9BURK|nr:MULTISPECIES: CbiX/SirB N-terminal domain-containing protein [Pseudoduganella]WBS04530.1 CbiX/SirB N-terminal domain-containing protein [Pseudoduganella sp. SL102]GGY57840.1 cobalamin biosynthesis protein CbiX [Pseudoduganella albidiflava]
MKQALILFAHGARAASWAAPFERLRDLVAAREPGVDVSLAFLELMSPRLPERAAELLAQGVTDLTVVPVFLGQGGHVLRDLPEMIDQLRADHPQLAIRVAEAAGENAAVLQAIADYCVGSLLEPR